MRRKTKFKHHKRRRPAAVEQQQQPDVFHDSVISRAQELGFTAIRGDNRVDFIVVNRQPGGSNERHITANHDGILAVHVYGKDLSEQYKALDILTALNAIGTKHICTGNSEDRFKVLKFDDRRGYIDNNCTPATVRHDDCHMLLSENHRCGPCNSFRASLRAGTSRSLGAAAVTSEHSTRTGSSSKTPLQCLTQQELVNRCRNIKSECDNVNKRYNSLQEKLCKISMSNDQHVEVPNNVNKVCLEAVEESKKPEEKSLINLFLAQQHLANQRSKNGMRWHPMIIRWALGLKMKSTSAYRYIAKSELFRLPSESTLSDYIYYRSAVSGLDINGLLELKARIPDGTDVALLADEMRLHDGILYKNGQMSGFIELDNLNSALAQAADSQQESAIATHVLTYMIQGMKCHLTYPVAIYSTKSATSVQMYSTFWECVGALELAGFKVRAFICDGASCNRRMFSMHAADYPDDAITYRCLNRFADRPIYFMSDVPHLLKTTRNCVENSGSHLKSRELMLNDKPILWRHIKDLYDTTLDQRGFTTLHKLKSEHIQLTSYSRMNVKLAAQVLSQSVANALTLKCDAGLSSTIQLIEMVNKAFDCLNVTSLRDGVVSRNSNLKPYTTTTDERLRWLEENFLTWLARWEDDIRQKTEKPQDAERHLLSRATRDGWKLTVTSFVALCKELLTVDGYKYVLSRKLTCQDVLEQFFSRQRQACGGNSAPSFHDVVVNTHAFKITRHIATERGTNCEHTASGSDMVDVIPLKRRKR